MSFKVTKNYLLHCGLDFSYCINKLVNCGDYFGELETCLTKKETPELTELIKYLTHRKDYDTEISYIKMIIVTLNTLRRIDADIIWLSYFYTGKKEIYYDRSVDYRHRLKASNRFYSQLKNI